VTVELNFATARELAGLIRAREVSASEVLEAHLDQIELINPLVNAIITLLPEQARERAAAADAALARGEAVGPLHGLPIAHKDTTETKGIRTTKGSPIYRDYVPEENDPASAPGPQASRRHWDRGWRSCGRNRRCRFQRPL
jgi:amidase